MLNKKRARSKRLAWELSHAHDAAWLDEKTRLDTEILMLEAAQDVFSKQIAMLNAKITKASVNLDIYTKDHRVEEVLV